MSNRSDLSSQALRGMALIAAIFFFVCTASAQAPPRERPQTPIETTPAVIAPAPLETRPQEPDADGMRRKICRERSDFDCFFFLHQRLAEKANALEQRMNELANRPAASSPPADLESRLSALEQRVNELANRPTVTQPSSPGLTNRLQTLQNGQNLLRFRIEALERRMRGSGGGKADGWDDVWSAINAIKRKVGM